MTNLRIINILLGLSIVCMAVALYLGLIMTFLLAIHVHRAGGREPALRARQAVQDRLTRSAVLNRPDGRVAGYVARL